MIRHFLKRADQVIAVSHATAEEAIARGLEAAKTRVIANGIAASAVCHAKASERDRHALEQAVGRPLMGKKILLTVGRLVQRKGVRHCVENILPHVFARRGDVVYLVVGEGKHRSEIEAAIARAGYQDSVFLLGRVSDELLGAVMRLAHVFVMPNVQVPGDMEGFGIAAIEASLAGLPVVASGIEGIRDAVVEGCNGFLITPQQPKAFAEKILTLLENEAERARFGNAGRQFTLEKFNWRHIAGEYLEAFEQLCAGKCKRSVSSISNVVSKKAGKLSTITPASGLNKLRQ